MCPASSYLVVCCCVHRRRFLPIIVALNMQKGWKLWTPRIQRSGPLNRSPRKPCCKSSLHRAHSRPAMTQHQEVCVSAGTHTCPVYVCVCMDVIGLLLHTENDFNMILLCKCRHHIAFQRVYMYASADVPLFAYVWVLSNENNTFCCKLKSK